MTHAPPPPRRPQTTAGLAGVAVRDPRAHVVLVGAWTLVPVAGLVGAVALVRTGRRWRRWPPIANGAGWGRRVETIGWIAVVVHGMVVAAAVVALAGLAGSARGG